jgi:hypothetical protein
VALHLAREGGISDDENALNALALSRMNPVPQKVFQSRSLFIEGPSPSSLEARSIEPGFIAYTTSGASHLPLSLQELQHVAAR